MQTLKDLPLLDIHTPERVYHGGAQTWYNDLWQRRAGCGPTSASNLIWYLVRSTDRLKPLWNIADASRAEFVGLMEEMFEYVKPTARGVNTTEIFSSGVSRFAAERGAGINCRVLNIPEIVCKRPRCGDVADFLSSAFGDGLPVAFLNLSNGKLQNLDNWHWVTLVGFDKGGMSAVMLDQGNKYVVDLGLWLKTTLLGGGFVVADPGA